MNDKDSSLLAKIYTSILEKKAESESIPKNCPCRRKDGKCLEKKCKCPLCKKSK